MMIYNDESYSRVLDQCYRTRYPSTTLTQATTIKNNPNISRDDSSYYSNSSNNSNSLPRSISETDSFIDWMNAKTRDLVETVKWDHRLDNMSDHGRKSTNTKYFSPNTSFLHKVEQLNINNVFVNTGDIKDTSKKSTDREQIESLEAELDQYLLFTSNADQNEKERITTPRLEESQDQDVSTTTHKVSHWYHIFNICNHD